MTNSYYEFVGTKIVSLNKDTTTDTVSTSISNTLPSLTNSQGRFKIQKFDVFVNVRNLLQAPLTYSRTKDETAL